MADLRSTAGMRSRTRRAAAKRAATLISGVLVTSMSAAVLVAPSGANAQVSPSAAQACSAYANADAFQIDVKGGYDVTWATDAPPLLVVDGKARVDMGGVATLARDPDSDAAHPTFSAVPSGWVVTSLSERSVSQNWDAGTFREIIRTWDDTLSLADSRIELTLDTATCVGSLGLSVQVTVQETKSDRGVVTKEPRVYRVLTFTDTRPFTAAEGTSATVSYSQDPCSGAITGTGCWAYNNPAAKDTGAGTSSVTFAFREVSCKLARGPRLNPGATQEGFPVGSNFMRRQGAVRIRVLFVRFPDERRTSATPRQLSDRMKRAADFWTDMSAGNMRMTLDPYLEWVQMPKRSTAYKMRRQESASFATLRAYVSAAVTSADPKVDFRGADAVMIVAGPTQPGVDYSVAWVGDPQVIPTADGVTIANAPTIGSDAWGRGATSWRVAAHEIGHALGIPDLYDYQATGTQSLQYTAGWNIMADDNGDGPEITAWDRWRLGWLADDQVTCVTGSADLTVGLTPVERRGGVQLIVVRLSATSALAIESRRQERYDVNVNPPGVLVYLVYTNVASGDGPQRMFIPFGSSLLDAWATLTPDVYATHEDIKVTYQSSTENADIVQVTR